MIEEDKRQELLKTLRFEIDAADYELAELQRAISAYAKTNHPSASKLTSKMLELIRKLQIVDSSAKTITNELQSEANTAP